MSLKNHLWDPVQGHLKLEAWSHWAYTHTHRQTESEHKLLLSALALRATASHCTVIKTNIAAIYTPHCITSYTLYILAHAYMCEHPEAHRLMLYSRKHYTHNRRNNDTKLACTKTGVRERQIGSKLLGESVRVFRFKSPCVYPDECKSTSLGRNQN